ncbi:MAG: riboflavin biosynthesis protein RibF [Candidatus Limnocylindria bacterium]
MTIVTVGMPSLPLVGPAVVAMGVFDGVHRGHRHLLAAALRAAREESMASVALAFHPHPTEVLRAGSSVPRLTPLPETLERLRLVGVDHAVAIRFDEALQSLRPEEFVADLAPAIELRALVMTPGSAFGRGRAGTPQRMAELGHEVVVVEPLLDHGEPISSSRVRAAIAAGDMAEATRLVGKPPMLVGTVVHGDRRGHELGFPTANLAFAYTPALPALGIYTGRVTVAERHVEPGHPALVSVGVRPTFHDDGLVLVEAYLLDWDGDLYGAELRLDVLERLRDERRFEGVDALVAQMRNDEAEARRRLGMGPSA